MAIVIALGATSMSDIAVLAQLAPVLGAAPSGSTVRRAKGRGHPSTAPPAVTYRHAGF
jgi:hypothetical protein